VPELEYFAALGQVLIRVARWFILKPKVPIWVNFGGPWIGKCKYILWPF
jgi:thiol-disulfide isomerase/thioredoxin